MGTFRTGLALRGAETILPEIQRCLRNPGSRSASDFADMPENADFIRHCPELTACSADRDHHEAVRFRFDTTDLRHTTAPPKNPVDLYFMLDFSGGFAGIVLFFDSGFGKMEKCGPLQLSPTPGIPTSFWHQQRFRVSV